MKNAQAALRYHRLRRQFMFAIVLFLVGGIGVLLWVELRLHIVNDLKDRIRKENEEAEHRLDDRTAKANDREQQMAQAERDLQKRIEQGPQPCAACPLCPAPVIIPACRAEGFDIGTGGSSHAVCSHPDMQVTVNEKGYMACNCPPPKAEK